MIPTLAGRPRRSPRGGFTLIEILVVVLIIAILSGFILAGVRRLVERQKVNVAVADIELIRNALEQYEQAWGQYPPADMFGNQINGANRALVACLEFEYDDADKDPTDPQHGPFLKSYIVRDSSRIQTRTIDSEEVRLWFDPWQNPYVYFERNTIREYDGDEPTYQILGNAEGRANGMPFRPRKDAPPDDESGLFYDALRFQIWSCGPDKRSSVDGETTDTAGRDDITSWNTGAPR